MSDHSAGRMGVSFYPSDLSSGHLLVLFSLMILDLRVLWMFLTNWKEDSHTLWRQWRCAGTNLMFCSLLCLVHICWRDEWLNTSYLNFLRILFPLIPKILKLILESLLLKSSELRHVTEAYFLGLKQFFFSLQTNIVCGQGVNLDTWQCSCPVSGIQLLFPSISFCSPWS